MQPGALGSGCCIEGAVSVHYILLLHSCAWEKASVCTGLDGFTGLWMNRPIVFLVQVFDLGLMVSGSGVHRVKL